MEHAQETRRLGGLGLERWLGPAAMGAVALAAILAALGTFGEKGDADTRGFLVVCVVIAVSAVVVYGFVVPRGMERAGSGRTALVLSVLAVLSVAVFWSGLPPILGVAGAFLGLIGWHAARGRIASRLAVVVGVIAVGADVAVAVGDWLANR